MSITEAAEGLIAKRWAESIPEEYRPRKTFERSYSRGCIIAPDRAKEHQINKKGPKK